MTLTEFLLARIADDEDFALGAAGWDHSGRERSVGRWHRRGIASLVDAEQRWVIYSDNDQLSGTVADHIARHDPARVLAECEAKRRIVESLDSHLRNAERYPDAYPGMVALADWHVRVLAAIYANHEDYRDEWRP